MATKLIELKDGTLVEVDLPGEQIERISGGLADKVDSTFEKIRPILLNIVKSFSLTWAELNKDLVVKEANVELGLNFEGEGNVYITKVSSGANLVVKLTLKPK